MPIIIFKEIEKVQKIVEKKLNKHEIANMIFFLIHKNTFDTELLADIEYCARKKLYKNLEERLNEPLKK